MSSYAFLNETLLFCMLENSAYRLMLKKTWNDRLLHSVETEVDVAVAKQIVVHTTRELLLCNNKLLYSILLN